MNFTLPHLYPLHDTSSLAVQHDRRLNWLCVQWMGYHDAESARAGCLTLLQLARETGCSHLLNDSSEVFGEWQAATEWIGRDLLPQLQEAGVQAVAWVNAMDWPSRSCVASSMHHIRGPLVATFEFDAAESAAAWLRAVGS